MDGGVGVSVLFQGLKGGVLLEVVETQVLEQLLVGDEIALQEDASRFRLET